MWYGRMLSSFLTASKPLHVLCTACYSSYQHQCLASVAHWFRMTSMCQALHPVAPGCPTPCSWAVQRWLLP
jgi:hypothetical protein